MAAALFSLALFLPAFRDAAAGRSFSPEGTPEGAAVPAGAVLIQGDFSGFSLLVYSEPDGATVAVDGTTRGRTPLVTNVECVPGRDLVVTVEHQGYAPWTRRGRCGADAILRLDARLEVSPARRR